MKSLLESLERLASFVPLSCRVCYDHYNLSHLYPLNCGGVQLNESPLLCILKNSLIISVSFLHLPDVDWPLV